MNSCVAETNCVLIRRVDVLLVVVDDVVELLFLPGNAGIDSRNLATVNNNSVSLSTNFRIPGLCTLTATSPFDGIVALYTLWRRLCMSYSYYQ